MFEFREVDSDKEDPYRDDIDIGFYKKLRSNKESIELDEFLKEVNFKIKYSKYRKSLSKYVICLILFFLVLLLVYYNFRNY